MARFKVLEKSFIGDRVYDEGAEVDFVGFPGPNLQALDKEGKRFAEQAPGLEVSAARLHMTAEGVPALDPITPA